MPLMLADRLTEYSYRAAYVYQWLLVPAVGSVGPGARPAPQGGGMDGSRASGLSAVAHEAKRKLYGVSDNAAAIAVGYATEAIARPKSLDPDELCLSLEQRQLVPLVARGMRSAQMATELNRPVNIIRRDGRDLMSNLRAKNPAHVVTRAWQSQILTAERVISWLP